MPRKKADELPPVERVGVRMAADGHAYRVPTPPCAPPREVDALGQPRLVVLCTCGRATYSLRGGGLAEHEGHVEFDPGPPTPRIAVYRSPQAEVALDAYIASFRKPAKTDPTPSPDRAVSLEPPREEAEPPSAKPPPPKKPVVRSTAPAPEPSIGDDQDPWLG